MKVNMKTSVKDISSKLKLIGYWLINLCLETGSERMNVTLELEDVKRKGKSVGTWKISVEKL